MHFAGPAAEERAGADAETILTQGSDMEQAADWAMSVCGSEAETDAFLTWLWEKARVFVAVPAHWRMIEALAAELLRKRKLTGKQARAVLEAAAVAGE